MSRVLKLNKVYERNAARLKIWAEQGLPYAVLIAQRGCDDITPLFASKAKADKCVNALNKKGINGAVALTRTEAEGGSYSYFVKAATVRTPF